jgi:hypothetical protein
LSKNGEAISAVSDLRKELDAILYDVVDSGNAVLGRSRFELWKERAVATLRVAVNQREATRLEQTHRVVAWGQGELRSLLDDISRHESALRALQEEIEAHPEALLTSGTESQQPTSVRQLRTPGQTQDEAADATPLEELERLCFVIGPIGDALASQGSPARTAYEESVAVWEKIIQPACASVDLNPIRADKLDRAGEITNQVFILLHDADVVIADVSRGNPNVLYELGLRHTRNLLTIQIGEAEKLPFDINVIRTIRFARTEGGYIEARDRLQAALENGLAGAFDPVTATKVWNRSVPSLDSAEIVSIPMTVEDDEQPGVLDLISQAEDSLGDMQATLTSFTEIIQSLGSATEASSAELGEARNKGGGAKSALPIVARFAKVIEPLVVRSEELAAKYDREMRGAQGGIDVILRQLEEDPAQLEDASDFVEMIDSLSAAASEGLEGMDGFAEAVASIEPISRVIRPTARRLRTSIESVATSTRVIEVWKQRIDLIGRADD